MPENWEFVIENGWISIINSDTQEYVAVEEYSGMYNDLKYNDFFESYSRMEMISNDFPASSGATITIYSFSTPFGEMQLYSLSLISSIEHGYISVFVFLNEDINENTLVEMAKSYEHSKK